MARILVGTSGWHYASWSGAFFPAALPLKQRLRYYSSRFETTELNSVFYRTPTPSAVRAWREQSAKDFLFAWKASKFITHWKRLSSKADTSLALLESRLTLLDSKAGPILFQLPPQFTVDQGRLESFCQLLTKRRRYSFEFRHPSWYTGGILRVLSKNNISLCISDHHDAPAPWKRTADFVYVRGHGPTGRYKGHYSDRTLNQWSERIQRWSRRGYEIYVYFDNDQKSAAPADAQRLRKKLRQEHRGRATPNLQLTAAS